MHNLAKNLIFFDFWPPSGSLPVTMVKENFGQKHKNIKLIYAKQHARKISMCYLVSSIQNIYFENLMSHTGHLSKNISTKGLITI